MYMYIYTYVHVRKQVRNILSWLLDYEIPWTLRATDIAMILSCFSAYTDRGNSIKIHQSTSLLFETRFLYIDSTPRPDEDLTCICMYINTICIIYELVLFSESLGKGRKFAVIFRNSGHTKCYSYVSSV